jgi:hypothetical protein
MSFSGHRNSGAGSIQNLGESEPFELSHICSHFGFIGFAVATTL